MWHHGKYVNALSMLHEGDQHDKRVASTHLSELQKAHPTNKFAIGTKHGGHVFTITTKRVTTNERSPASVSSAYSSAFHKC